MREHPFKLTALSSARTPSPRGAATLVLGKHLRLALWLASWWALGFAPAARAAQFDVDAVKAAFLHRFAAYVEWAQPLPPDTHFTIAVFGAEGVTHHLHELLPELRIQERQAQVRAIDAADPLDEVRILYIGSGQLARAKPMLAAAVGRPILIVTDDPGGLAAGGVINFVQMARNVRFEISLPAAARNGLQLNSGLLSVAVRVENGPRAHLEPQIRWAGTGGPGSASWQRSIFSAAR